MKICRRTIRAFYEMIRGGGISRVTVENKAGLEGRLEGVGDHVFWCASN